MSHELKVTVGLFEFMSHDAVRFYFLAIVTVSQFLSFFVIRMTCHQYQFCIGVSKPPLFTQNEPGY